MGAFLIYFLFTRGVGIREVILSVVLKCGEMI